MGRFFTSFDEAWRFFLDRQEYLEDFFATFREQDSSLLGWLLRLDDDLLPAVQTARQAFSHFDWITPVPDHFLHTWIGAVSLGSRVPLGGRDQRCGRACAVRLE